LRGIPTMHNGIKYRSLLEAKWASFFTRIGWQFEYEPFEGNGYIPDFVIYGQTPFAVEVKPAVSWKELYDHKDKVAEGLFGVWQHDVLIVGASPFALIDECGDAAVGLLGEYQHDMGPDPQSIGEKDCDREGFIFGSGIWSRCPACGEPAVTHDYMSWQRRPCSHYDGSQWAVGRGELEALRVHWKRACNEVQWRGAA
jgi:hypothetical protein